MPPSATPRQRAFEAAVGRAANPRNPDGSTPSTAVYAPLTRIRTASTGSAAVTSWVPETAESRDFGSENGATTIRSAVSVRLSGATVGSVAAAATAGTADFASSAPPSTEALPVTGLTGGSAATLLNAPEGTLPAEELPATALPDGT